MKYFGYLGESLQIVYEDNNQTTPDDLVVYDDEGNEVSRKQAILMNGERLQANYVADENGNWIVHQLTEDELSKEILQKRDELMEIAYRKIRVIEVDIKLANHNPEDDDTPAKRNLTAWETYLSQLNKIEQQPNFPYEIDWPTMPDEQTT